MNPNTSAALVWPMILGILDDNEKGRKRLRDVLQGFADEGIVFSPENVADFEAELEPYKQLEEMRRELADTRSELANAQHELAAIHDSCTCGAVGEQEVEDEDEEPPISGPVSRHLTPNEDINPRPAKKARTNSGDHSPERDVEENNSSSDAFDPLPTESQTAPPQASSMLALNIPRGAKLATFFVPECSAISYCEITESPVQLACCFCGVNAPIRGRRYFEGAGGLLTHIWGKHRMDPLPDDEEILVFQVDDKMERIVRKLCAHPKSFREAARLIREGIPTIRHAQSTVVPPAASRTNNGAATHEESEAEEGEDGDFGEEEGDLGEVEAEVPVVREDDEVSSSADSLEGSLDAGAAITDNTQNGIEEADEEISPPSPPRPLHSTLFSAPTKPPSSQTTSSASQQEWPLLKDAIPHPMGERARTGLNNDGLVVEAYSVSAHPANFNVQHLHGHSHIMKIRKEWAVARCPIDRCGSDDGTVGFLHGTFMEMVKQVARRHNPGYKLLYAQNLPQLAEDMLREKLLLERVRDIAEGKLVLEKDGSWEETVVVGEEL